MARIFGLPEPRLDGLIGELEALAMAALRSVGRAAARLLGSGGPPSADDLAVVPVVWGQHVDDVFVPVIGQVWSESAGHLAAQLVEVGYEDGTALTPSASDYLAVARNRLRDVGDEVWETLREDLAEGIAAGEGVEELAARIEASTGVGQARAERIARTEVIAASNAASLAVANLANLPGAAKEWLATPDARTREAHRLADGQRVPLGEPFEVGGVALRFPGDPDGPADLVVNCRCSIGYAFGDDVSDIGDALTAAAEVHTGAMIALIPSEEDAARLAVDGGEPVDELHTTLLYLGDAASYPEEARAQVLAAVENVAAVRGPLTPDGFAVSIFNPPGVEQGDGRQRDTCIVLGLSGDDLEPVHEAVADEVRTALADHPDIVVPDQHAPWQPHVTLTYTDDVGQAEALTDRVGPVTFDRIRVAFAGENFDFPLTPAEDLEVEDAEDDDFDWESHIAESIRVELQSRMPEHLQRYWIRRLALGTPGSFRRCVAALRQHYPQNTEGLCANLYHEATGRWPGRKEDNDGADVAKVSVMAVMDGDGAVVDFDFSPAEVKAVTYPDGVTAEGVLTDILAVRPGEHWHAVANIEGVTTGLRRFTENALTWRELPFAFHWQYNSSAHGGQAQTAHVGLVTRVERDGPVVHMFGTLDLGCERGREYGRRLAEGFERWVSIGLDESFRESDIEYIWPAGFDAEIEVEDVTVVEPEEMVISKGRIGELTGVSVPAQQEATIEPTPELIEAMAALVAATHPHNEAKHPRGFGGKWVRKGTGDGVTTDVPTADGGHVAVDADDDGRVGVGVDSESGRSTATLAPQSAADLAEVMRGGLDDGEEVIVDDGDSRVSLSRDGDVYQLDVGADSTVVAEADLPAVADTIAEAVSGPADVDTPDGDGEPLEEASAADMDLTLHDDGSVDVEWEDGGFNIAADELAPLAEAFAAVAATPEDEWPTSRTAGAFTVTVDEMGDVELSWPDGGAAFDLDETDGLASALQQLSARWNEEVIDLEEPMAASANPGEGRRRLASATVPRTRRSTVIVAAGHTITIPTLPPPHWFTEPTDVTALGALTVTDEGRVYGYLAPARIAHRAFRDRRQEVPMGRVDYGRWMGGEALVAGGRAVAGPITMNCGHMSPTASADPTIRMEHYDNTCSIVAQAAIGENANGVWIAGALLPGVTAEQVTRMMACRLSGDWAPHPERPGWMEFVAALLVPVPGFPMARSGPSVRIADGALVAAAVPVRLVDTAPAAEPEQPETQSADLAPTMERLARTIGLDWGTRMARLRDRVTATDRP
jgi:hypothetical protein